MPPASGRPAAANAQTRDHLLDLLAPVVAATGHDLEDVTVAAAGRRTVVRVVVDADGGVDLDAVAAVSRAVSDALDEDTPGGAAFAGPFVLEVTSPGVARPLIEQRHWRRAMGRMVAVSVGEKTVTGRVVATSATGVTLDVGGVRHEVRWAELGQGRIHVEFSHADDDTASREG